ncbi:FERM domain-containing protein 3-like [Diabrotica undecimpunctata]|uniref:FERM domain-containing protein 3-like n=1 Tax=Diabrotica undecimpunctata TaxID=50387 RepID=UPI003B632950
MKTETSKRKVEIFYPCSVHLLTNGSVVDCEYKLDNIGNDLLDYICEYLHVEQKCYWGLRYVDEYGQKHWLDENKLIHSQVKNTSLMHFYFRVKIYPPDPFKVSDDEAKYQIFMQLRLDLVSGKLGCKSCDAVMLIALILQYSCGDFDDEVHLGNYVQEKIVMNQTFSIEMKAIEIHKNYLKGITIYQAEDLFLRMACQLETYGVEPYLVENIYGDKMTLWINYKGVAAYKGGREVHKFDWMSIVNVTQEDDRLVLNLTTEDNIKFYCFTTAQCDYIFQATLGAFAYFTSLNRKNIASQVQDREDSLKSVERVEVGSEIEVLNSSIILDSSSSFVIIYKACRLFKKFRYLLFIAMMCIFIKVFRVVSWGSPEIYSQRTWYQNYLYIFN